jgi:uncharacterized protein YbjT (DUF2867 family)
LTNSLQRSNPFGGSIKAFPYNFSEPHELEKTLRGLDVLINTYWVRFDNPPHFTFAQALANTKILFDAARRAGVGRIVHISITNPDRNSRLPYFRAKAEIEDYLKLSGISHAIGEPFFALRTCRRPVASSTCDHCRSHNSDARKPWR